jgi:glycogen debranching enzyme
MTLPSAEWLEADGLGGFASGTSAGPRSRRYHGLLLVAMTPPTGRVMLVNGLEAWVETPAGRFAISSQRYAPGVVHPDGMKRLVAFTNDAWPRWTYQLEDGTTIEQELAVQHGAPVTALSWRLREPREDVRLFVRLLLSGRDYHSTHHENSSFRFAADAAGQRVTWKPYDGLPPVTVVSNGRYCVQPEWYRNFLYEEERTRGLDAIEDLASPGVFAFDLSRGMAALVLSTTDRTVTSPATDHTDNTVASPVTDHTENTVSLPATDNTDNTVSSPATDHTDNTVSLPATHHTENTGASPATDHTDNTVASPVTDHTDNTVASPVTDHTDNTDHGSVIVEQIFARERRRRTFPSVLQRAADSYLVQRGNGKTIVAGYPWFTDWGRDTFISIRGLCLSTGRLDEARQILLAWSGTVSQGMLPNRFPDQGDAPEYNSVDASLWYVIAVHDFLTTAERLGFQVTPRQQSAVRAAVDAILEGYSAGTRYGIRADADGLLACGSPGVQLTWMDAKVGDWVVTPRSGKPVEIQALWLNALWVAGHWTGRWTQALALGTSSFRARFWNDADGCLVDVVDVDHVPGAIDPAFRPNQILAIGGLPLSLLDGPYARRVVDAVESRLVTPMGLRSLAPGSPGYAPRYEGNGAQRDARYHQGTVWPWLIGPFVEAWLRVRGSSAPARIEARARFLEPLLQRAAQNGGHLPEIADAEAPHTPRGCPFQAWSVAEVLRLDLALRTLEPPEPF